MPAEILRDDTSAATLVAPEPAAAPAPAPPPGAVPGAVDLGALARNAFVTSPERISSLIGAKGAAQQPAIEAARSSLQSPMPSDAGLKGAEDRIRDVSAQLPMKGARAFLSPVEGEDPLMSIQKLVQAVGLFAGGIGVRGSAHGAARASVAALTGALAGWNEGDRERGNRELQTWKLKSDEALKAWELENAAYTRALSQRGLSLDEKMKQIALIAAEHDNPIAAEQVRAGGAMGFVDYLTKAEDTKAKFAESRARLIQSHDERERDRDLRRELADRDAALRRDLARERSDQKAADAKTHREELLAAYPPEVLKSLGQQWALDPNGRIQGLGFGKDAQIVRPMIVEAGLGWLREQGIDPESLPHVRAEVGSAKNALNNMRKVNSIQAASIRRFEGHADKLLELSEQVDRSNRPVIARYQLKSRGEYGGDPDVAAFQTQAYEMAQELAKLVVGSAQGDANTREEARKLIDAALNKEQLKSVISTLRGNAERNIEKNKESEGELLKIVDTAGGLARPKGGAGATAAPPPPGASLEQGRAELKRLTTSGMTRDKALEAMKQAGWK